MKQQTETHAQVHNWASLLNDKLEILHRENYYTRVLSNCGKFLEVLNDKIDKAADDYEKCKLTTELHDCELKIETTKNFHKHWSGRKAVYDTEMVILNAECDIHYNFVMEEGKKLALNDKNLANTMKNWESYKANVKPEDDLQKMKTDSYVFMKKYIVDHYEYKLKKEFVLPKSANVPAPESGNLKVVN